MPNDRTKTMTDAEKNAARECFIKALDAWAEDGVSKVTCDECGKPIEFEQKGTTTWHSCACGKFDVVMRGL